MKISPAIENCNSMADIVDIINKGGNREHSAEEIAAQYAYMRTEDKNSFNQILFWLDILFIEAKFNYSSARMILLNELSKK